MKKLLVCALFVLISGLYAAPVLTVIGGKGALQLEQYGLIVNYFNPQENMSRSDTLKLCESIDNSKLVIFYGGIKATKIVFADKSVQQAMTNLFRRGGGFYCGIPSWTWMSSKPQAMFDYFKSIDAPLPENYSGFAKKGVSMDGKFTAEFADSWAAKPNKSFPIYSRGQAGKNYDKRYKVLIESVSGNYPLALVREDVLGKGTLVCNYAAMMHYNPVSPFLENMITHLYGDRKVGMRKRPAAAATPAAAQKANYIDLSKVNTFKLGTLVDGKTPQLPTEVSVSSNGKALVIDYVCYTPEPEKLRRRVKKADGPVFSDDCVEIFIMDSIKDSGNMHQFALNSDNILYDSRNGAPLWNCDNIKTSTKINKDNFTAHLEIPFKSLGIDPAKKQYFKLNLCREARGGVKIGTYELQSLSVTPAFQANLIYCGFSAEPPATTKERGKSKSNGIQLYEVLPFEKIYADYEPAANTPETKVVKFTTARNDREGIPVVMLNNSDMNLRYRVEPDEFVANKRNSYNYREVIKVKELLPYRAVNKQVFFDIISDLNQAGVVSVPGYDLGALYLEVFTNIKPGIYKWGLTLVPVNADVPQKRLEVEIEVVNYTMPEKLGVDFYLFGPYVAGQRYYVGRPEFTRGQFDKYNELFKAYHVTTIHVWDPLNKAVQIKNGKVIVSDNKEDYLFREKEWQASGLEWSYHYGVWAVLHQRLKAAKLPSTLKDPAIRAAFEKAIANWSKFMKEENIDFNRCYVPVWDEPRSADIDDVITAADIVRKHGFRVNQTMANWSVPDDFRRLKNSVDYWIPIEYLVTTAGTAPEVRQIIKESGKKLAPYMCSIGGVIEQYHEYYRFRGIKEYLINADGINLWASNSWRGNEYDSREDKKMRGMFVVMHGNDGPVSTLRFEALREALEDLYYLKEAKRTNKAGKLIAPDKLKELMKNNDPAEIARWHAELLRELAK